MTTILRSGSRLSVVAGAPAAAVEPIVSPSAAAAAPQRPAPLSRVVAGSVGDLPFMARFAVINLVGLALIGAAWAAGLLFKPYEADSSGMCYLITALFGLGLVAVSRKDWLTVRWAGNALINLCLDGTVLGLIMPIHPHSVVTPHNFIHLITLPTPILY